MACYIYLRGDPDGMSCAEAADVILHRVENTNEDDFLPFAVAPLARDDESRTAYVRSKDVVAVMPIHPRQLESELDDPPDWYTK